VRDGHASGKERQRKRQAAAEVPAEIAGRRPGVKGVPGKAGQEAREVLAEGKQGFQAYAATRAKRP